MKKWTKAAKWALYISLAVLILPPLFTTISCSEEEKIVLTEEVTTINATTKSPLTGMEPIHAMTNKNKAITDAVYETDLNINGCTFDSTTGIYKGIPQESGIYVSHITAHSPSHPKIQSNTITITLNISEQVASSFIVDVPHQIHLTQTVNMQEITITTKTNTNVVLTDAVYAITSGSLPTGISFSNVGEISGITTADTGTYAVTFKVTSTSYPGIEKERTIDFVVAAGTLTISGLKDSYSWTVGLPIDVIHLSVTGPESATVSNPKFYIDPGTQLPKGIKMTDTGLIQGIPVTQTILPTHIAIQCTGTVDNVQLQATTVFTSVTVFLPSQLSLRYLQEGMDLKGLTVNCPATNPKPSAPPDYTNEILFLNGSTIDDDFDAWVVFVSGYYPGPAHAFQCVFKDVNQISNDWTQFYSTIPPASGWVTATYTFPTDKSYIVTTNIDQLNNFSSTFWDMAQVTIPSAQR